jgi:uncharacterized membrane protein YfcA
MTSLNPISAFLATWLPGHSIGELAFVLLAAVIAGLARGFSGFGGALIFIPLAGAATSPQIASGLLLVIDWVMTPGMLARQCFRSCRR